MPQRALAIAFGLMLWISPAAAANVASAWQAYLAGQHATALAALRPLAEKGDAAAQFYLGTLYCDGLAVARDYREAALWLTRSAEQGHADAQFTLGFLYYNGAASEAGTLQPSPDAAAHWLALAASRGIPMAQYLMGRMYQEGYGVMKDDAKALSYAKSAAEHGIVGAQFLAGALLGNRRHAARDWVEAYAWLELAARRGHPAARQNLEQIAKRLNVKEIAEAQAAADAWQSRRQD